MDATFKAMGLGIEDFLLLFNAFKHYICEGHFF